MGNEPGEPLLESRRKILKGIWPFAISLAGNDTLAAKVFFGLSERMLTLVMNKGQAVSLEAREKIERGIAQLEVLQSGRALVSDRATRITSPDPHYVFDAALWDYERSHFHRAITLLERCLVLCELRHDDHCRAKALRARGSARSFLGDHVRAREDTETAVNLSQLVNDAIGEADGYEALAWVELQCGDIEAAEGHYERALKIGDVPMPTCDVSVIIGSCEYGKGRALLTRAVWNRSRPTEARSLFTRGWRTFGTNEIGRGNCTFGLGLCYLLASSRPDLEAARAHFNQGCDHYKLACNDQGIALCTLGLAHVAAAAGNLAEALEFSSTAHSLFETNGNPRGANECRKVEAWAKEPRTRLTRRVPVLSKTWWQI